MVTSDSVSEAASRFLHRCDGARVGQKRDTDRRPGQKGGGLDVGGQRARLAETSAALRSRQEGSRCGCEAQEETGFSGRIRDQNQESDGKRETKTSSDEEAVSSVALKTVKKQNFFYISVYSSQDIRSLYIFLCFVPTTSECLNVGKSDFRCTFISSIFSVFLLYCNKVL